MTEWIGLLSVVLQHTSNVDLLNGINDYDYFFVDFCSSVMEYGTYLKVKTLYKSVMENKSVNIEEIIHLMNLVQHIKTEPTECCKKSEIDNISSSLLLLPAVKMLFKVEQLYGEECQALIEKDIISYLLNLLYHNNNKFVIHCTSDCICAVLQSSFSKRVRHTVLQNIVRNMGDLQLNVYSSIAIVEFFKKSLSGRNNEPFTGFVQDVFQVLQPKWRELVNEFVINSSQFTSEEEQYLVSTFLVVWKKLLKCSFQLSNELLSESMNTLKILLENIDIIPTHCCYKAVDVLITSLKEKEIRSTNCTTSEYAFNLLNLLVSSKLKYLISVNIPGDFLGVGNTVKCCSTYNRKLTRKTVLLCLCCSYIVTRTSKNSGEGSCSLSEDKQNLVLHFLHQLNLQIQQPLYENLMELFGDQDDHMVDVMYYLLHIHLAFKSNGRSNLVEVKNNRPNESVSRMTTKIESDTAILCDKLNPHILFIQFLKTASWDYSLLLDFIISPETKFLQFLIEYLKYTLSNWDELREKCLELSSSLLTCDKCDDDVELQYCHNSEPVLNNISIQTVDKQLIFESKKLNLDKSTYGNIKNVSKDNVIKDTSIDIAQFSNIDKDPQTDLDCNYNGDLLTKSVCKSNNTALVNYSDSSESENSEDERYCSDGIILNKDEDLSNCKQEIGIINCQSISSKDEQEKTHHNLKRKFCETNVICGSSSNEKELERENSGCNTYNSANTVVIDKYMAVVIRLGLKIERMIEQDIFPFTAKPLLLLIHNCETLYEKE